MSIDNYVVGIMAGIMFCGQSKQKKFEALGQFNSWLVNPQALC